jgi:hypothetical protein
MYLELVETTTGHNRKPLRCPGSKPLRCPVRRMRELMSSLGAENGTAIGYDNRKHASKIKRLAYARGANAGTIDRQRVPSSAMGPFLVFLADRLRVPLLRGAAAAEVATHA